MHWLLKSDPETYGFDDLVRDGKTVWDGVKNPQALGYIGQMKAGDMALVYHSNEGKAIVGLARITSDPYPDPKAKDPRLLVVDLAADRRLARPVPLADIKADPAFKDFALVRQARLSVMPVTPAQWNRLLAMAGMKAP
ncbi:MAG: EVE domain-containing protein [Gemmatimonadota bacterium]